MRGKLLFRVTAEHQRQRIVWMAVAGVMALILAFDAIGEHRADWSSAIFLAGYALSFAVSRKVTVYENGIHFPQEPSGGRARFIAWSQIERFYWDGDVLTVVPNQTLLSTGGGSIGTPVQGGSVRIPAARRIQVENLVASWQNSRVAQIG